MSVSPSLVRRTKRNRRAIIRAKAIGPADIIARGCFLSAHGSSVDRLAPARRVLDLAGLLFTLPLFRGAEEHSLGSLRPRLAGEPRANARPADGGTSGTRSSPRGSPRPRYPPRSPACITRSGDGALDLLRYGSVLWLLKRSRFDERELAVLFGALAIGAVGALAHGYWRLEVTGQRKFLELKSVGHVNHSAIYLAILLGRR
jgi:hypothetical protein